MERDTTTVVSTGAGAVGVESLLPQLHALRRMPNATIRRAV